MLPVEIRPNIYWIGLNDRTTDLFEGLWPIKHEGVSLNSYFIDDEKKVIVDATREITLGEMLHQLSHFTDLSKIDYLVVNHMEPDHTGALHTIRQMAPCATILCSERASRMMVDFYGMTEGVRAVKDGETLNIGQHTLKFVSTPNVHWPETMMTVELTEQILFSCDAFGGFGALEGAIFDDETPELDYFEREALRYYTNIVANRSKSVLNAIKKLSNEPIQIIAPSHGLIWRKNPGRIVDLYKHWAELAQDPGEVGITLIFGSMYGDTNRMAEAIQIGIQDEGVPFSSFEVTHTHPSYILPSLWTKRGVLVGAPTYEGELFPPMKNMLQIARFKRVSGKLAARFGSYGWGGGAQKVFEAMAAEMEWRSVQMLEFMGSPSADDLRKGQAFGAAFARLVKEETSMLVSLN
jgi:flavorubredoxin